MKNDLIIKRRFAETDKEKIVNLFQYVFKEQSSIDWFLWKYLHSPWGSTGYVAEYNKEIICFYGGIRQRFIFNNKILWAYQLCDVMTHPDFRGKLFSKTPIVTMLGELLYDENDMDFAFGFPSIRHAKLQTLRLGGEGYRLITQFIKEIHNSNNKISGIVEGWNCLSNKSLDSLISRYDKDTLVFYKNSDYISWRYFKHPIKKYNFLLFKGIFRPVGFVVYSIKDNYVNILEFKVLHKRNALNILNKMETYFSRLGIKGVKIWCHQRSYYFDLLIQSGYISNTHIPIAFKLVNSSCGLTSDFFYDNFFYSMGDYDAS